MNTARFVVIGFSSLLAAQAVVSAQSAAKPKLGASTIQIAMVEAGDVQIPAEFRFAIYERLVERVRASGAFQNVYRTGDHAADGFPDLITLHTKVETFKEGSQTKRELTTILGATKVDVTASVTSRDGRTLMDQKITGRVRFFGENLGVTNDLAKRITKLVHDASLAGR
jgi:hypothetical protein